MAAFRHAPLNDRAEEIRLLRLVPQQAGLGPVEMEMGHFTLGMDCPRFSAISYRWDPSPPTCEISINGRPFAVRDNVTALFEELRCRNDSYREQYIWIDAICINQKNTRERNHQVKLMRSIYSMASGVLVWLGSASDDSDFAINYIELADSRQSLPNLWAPFTPVKCLLNREYWTRIWVVQEILLARDITILCGSKRLEWASLKRLCTMFQGLRFKLRMGSEQRRAVDDVVATGAFVLVKEKEEFRTSDTRQLSVLLGSHKFGRFKCTDPRDKVYGLLGISMERERIVVDYRKTMEDIYIDVTQASIPEREIMHEFSRAVKSIAKNDEFRPFLARLLYVLDIDSDSIHQSLLPRMEKISRGPEQSRMVWRDAYYWEAEQGVVQPWPSRQMITGMQTQRGQDDDLYLGCDQRDQMSHNLGVLPDTPSIALLTHALGSHSPSSIPTPPPPSNKDETGWLP